MKTYRILYKNWQGEIGERTIVPNYLWEGSTKYHPKEQLLLNAFDLEKQASRDFALKDILKWID